MLQIVMNEYSSSRRLYQRLIPNPIMITLFRSNQIHTTFPLLILTLVIPIWMSTALYLGVMASQQASALRAGASAQSSDSCKEAISDTFNGEVAPIWVWTDPYNDATYDPSARPDYLRITAPRGNDLYPGFNYDAPRLLQPITGDFVMETRLEADPAYNYQGAGLLIWQDSDNFVRLELGYGGVAGGNVRGIRLDREYNGGYIAVSATPATPTSATIVELRLTRRGEEITASWRFVDQAWQAIAGTTMKLNAELFIGITAIANPNVPTSIIADFAHVRISCPLPVPFLELPLPHTASENALSRVHSLFDHAYPYGILGKPEPVMLSTTLLSYAGYPALVGTVKNCRSAVRCYSGHEGIDFSKFGGFSEEERKHIPVLAAADGTVVKSEKECGLPAVHIVHNNHFKTVYLHLANDEYLVTEGTVLAGQRIGTCMIALRNHVPMACICIWCLLRSESGWRIWKR
ncbi:MAG: DUF1349 domain-containing protein [Caldilineaceae bacterium]